MAALYLVLLLFLSQIQLPVAAETTVPSFPIKAVNLGGWLVVEKWITPSLFSELDGELLDGTQVQFKSVTQNKYMCAEGGGGGAVVANRSSASGWETFKLWRINSTHFQFRAFGRQFVGVQLNSQAGRSNLIAVASTPGSSHTFEIVRSAPGSNRVRIRAPNGFFLQVRTETLVTPDFRGDGSWGDDDPSVFLMNAFGGLGGEYQLTNGLGPGRAPEVMRDHWQNFIVEKDFQFMKEKGLDAVRIPVGWWIARDPNPPQPFVGGSLQALDNAFSWARRYGLKVIVDLHAAPGSQNAYEHSASRDGGLDWGATEETISQTVEAIDFLAARYAGDPALLAIELLNEPSAWPPAVNNGAGITVETLKRYYAAGYDAVRRHTADAYVVVCFRLSGSDGELLDFARGRSRTVLDLHYYNLYNDEFKAKTVQQHIDYVYRDRAAQLRSNDVNGGPLIFVGQWVAEWDVKDASKEDYQRFAEAQIEVYGKASFGWAYWTFRNVAAQHWSLEWMINNSFISSGADPQWGQRGSLPPLKFKISLNILNLPTV